MTNEEIKIAKHRYYEQKKHTSRVDICGNKIEMKLSFEQWLDIWISSGHWNDRGRGTNGYCMSRINDTGHYEIGNVFIRPYGENSAESNSRRKKKSIMTPSGLFESRSTAAKHYNVAPNTILLRIRKSPTEYYYL